LEYCFSCEDSIFLAAYFPTAVAIPMDLVDVFAGDFLGVEECDEEK
jgi:hypothetical protein